MADIELPQRVGGSAGRRSRLNAPTATDVPRARIPSDPGLRVPQSFGSGEGLVKAGEGLMNFGADVARVSIAADRARRKAAVSAATVKATGELKSFVLDLEHDTDYPTFGDRFKERAEAAFKTHGEGLDEDGRRLFRSNFEQLSMEQALAVRKLGNKRVVDQATADLDWSLDGYADIAAKAGTDEERGKALDQASAAIDNLVESGIVSAEEGGKRKRGFLGKLDEVDARTLMLADPEKAVESLADPSLFPNLDENRRISLIDAAARRHDTQVRQRTAAAEKAERQAEKRLKDAQEEREKAGWDLWRQNQLTQEWLAENKSGLSGNQVEAFARVLRGEEKDNDRDAFSDLQKSLHSDPQEAERMAYRYHKDGLINDGTLSSTVEKARTFSRQEGPKSQYERSRDFIRSSLDPGPLVDDPISRGRAAEALALYDSFADEQQRSDDDLDSKSRDIVERFRFVDLTRARFSLPVPYGASTTREAVDMPAIEAAEDRLAESLSANRIGRAEFNNESRYLKRWRETLEREKAAQQNREPGRK